MASKIKKSDTKELVNQYSYIYFVRPTCKHLESEFSKESKYNLSEIIKIGRAGDSEDRFKEYKKGGKNKGIQSFIKYRDIMIKREDEETAEYELKKAFKKQFKECNAKKMDKKTYTEYYINKDGMLPLFDSIINKYQIKQVEIKECNDNNANLQSQIKQLQEENAELKKQLNKPKDEEIVQLLECIDRLNEDKKILMQENKVLSNKYEDLRQQLDMYESKMGDHTINLVEIAKYCSERENVTNNTDYNDDWKRIYMPAANSKASNTITAKFMIDEFKGMTNEEYSRHFKQPLDKLLKKHTKLKDVSSVNSRIEGIRFVVDYIYDK
jgi:hypothetical protein